MHKHSDDDVEDLDFASLSIRALLSQAVMGQGPFEMTWKHGTVVQLSPTIGKWCPIKFVWMKMTV